MKNFSFFTARNLIRKISLFALISVFSLKVNSQTITLNTVGTHDGWYYSFWNDNKQGTASMTLGSGGNYTTTWTNVSNFVAGKGWKVGKASRSICFDGTFDGGSNGYLAVYGWTTNQFVEYYVVENHGVWNPPSNTYDIQYMGSFECDGGTYKIYQSRKLDYGINPSSLYWSIRTETRSSGTVTFSKHVEEWQKYGMNLGAKWEYQLVLTEGYQSSGNSNITVFECDPSTVIVDINLQTTTFTAPATIEISATATTSSNAIVKVEFFNGATKLGEDTSEPFSFSWENVPVGSYSLTAVATDNADGSATSVPVPVTVKNITNRIVLQKGWNILGSPLAVSTPLNIALQEIWDKVESVKDYETYYYRSNPEYLNTLLNLEKGRGYLIKVDEQCEINW